MYFGPYQYAGKAPSFFAGKSLLNKVPRWSHLGNILDEMQNCENAISFRKNWFFFGQANDVQCGFQRLKSATKSHLLKTLCSRPFDSKM
jgi:hypothetical protein